MSFNNKEEVNITTAMSDEPRSHNYSDENLDGEMKDKQDPTIPRDGVTTRVLAAYSVGHFANDLCASMWFIYLSYYLVYVVELSENVAGLALLSG